MCGAEWDAYDGEHECGGDERADQTDRGGEHERDDETECDGEHERGGEYKRGDGGFSSTCVKLHNSTNEVLISSSAASSANSTNEVLI